MFFRELYVAVALVAVGGVGAPALAETSSPLERAAQVFALPGTALATGIGAITAMLGVLLSQLLGISRMMFAMARRRDLPAVRAHLDERHDVPGYAILLPSAVLILVALFGSLAVIVAAAAFTILLYYSITNLAALRMRAEDKLFPNWVTVLGLISCLVLAVSEKVGSLKQQLDDPAYPQITYRRGAAGSPEPVLRGSGLRVQTVVTASQQWALPPARIAEEYGQPESAIREALAFCNAHRAEIDASSAAEEALEPRAMESAS